MVNAILTGSFIEEEVVWYNNTENLEFDFLRYQRGFWLRFQYDIIEPADERKMENPIKPKIGMRTKGSLIIQNLSANPVKVVTIIFIVFYSVGIIGLTLPFAFPIFSKLVPFALLLSFAGILLFHQHKADLNTSIVFFGIFLLGFAI